MAILQIIISMLFLISIQGAIVHGFCEGIQDQTNTSLTARHVPPFVHLVSYPPLSNIMETNYRNISGTYTSVVERHQSATTLKNIMAKRVGREFPPPHQHCFIKERNEAAFLYNPAEASDNFSSRLIEDTMLLYNASKALDMMIDYEKYNVSSTTMNLTISFVYLKTSLDNIIESLSNITGVTVNETEMIGSGDGSDGDVPDREEENSQSGTVYGRRNNQNEVSYPLKDCV